MAQLQTALPDIPGRQAYFLDVPGIASAERLSVVEFSATEKMGEPTEVSITFIHPLQLPRTDYLNLDASFTIVPDDGAPKKISGYLDKFSKIQQTNDYTMYRVVLKSHFARLLGITNSQTFQHLSTPQIIHKILRSHGIKDHQMAFRLRRQYPRHLWRFQYQMTDFSYVQMLMQKSGIYAYIVETEYGDQVVFGDDIDHYVYDPRLIVPYGYLNSVGYYVVRLDADFGNWPNGGESVPLRLAKPFAGKLQTGLHFVALDNDEAVISFRDGDPGHQDLCREGICGDSGADRPHGAYCCQRRQPRQKTSTSAASTERSTSLQRRKSFSNAAARSCRSRTAALRLVARAICFSRRSQYRRKARRPETPFSR